MNNQGEMSFVSILVILVVCFVLLIISALSGCAAITMTMKEVAATHTMLCTPIGNKPSYIDRVCPASNQSDECIIARNICMIPLEQMTRRQAVKLENIVEDS